MLIKYNSCIYCNSKQLELQKKQGFEENFYTKAIYTDLNLSKRIQKKIKIYKCKKCNIVQHNPWFNQSFSRKIYSNIYGQHNRGWENLLGFISKGTKPDHGILFDILIKNIKINSYAEYNSPFMGLMFNFFYKEIKKQKKFNKNFYDLIFRYLKSRQVAGYSKNLKKKLTNNAGKIKKKILFLKKKNLKNNEIADYVSNLKQLKNIHLKSICYWYAAISAKNNKNIELKDNFISKSQDLLTSSSEKISDWFQREAFLKNIVLHNEIINFYDNEVDDLSDLELDLKENVSVNANKNASNKTLYYKFCTNCGYNNSKQYKFCIECGNNLEVK